MTDCKPLALNALYIALALYLTVSLTVYRFNHQDMTETQLFMAIPEALMWGGQGE